MLVIGGVGWLYGGIAGAVVFKLLQDNLSSITPQYWMFWIGLFLVLLVLVGRERLLRPWTWFGEARRMKRMSADARDIVLSAHGPGQALRRHHRHQQRHAEPARAARAMR